MDRQKHRLMIEKTDDGQIDLWMDRGLDGGKMDDCWMNRYNIKTLKQEIKSANRNRFHAFPELENTSMKCYILLHTFSD